MIASWWNHHSSQDCLQIDSWELEHNLIKQILLIQAFVSSRLQPVFSGSASFIMNCVRLIPIVICLNEEPICIWKFIETMNPISVTFNHCSFITFSSRNNKINRGSNSLTFQSLNCSRISCLLIYHLFNQPTSGNCVLHQNTNEILIEMGFSSCIDLDRKWTWLVCSESEDASNNRIWWIHKISSFVVLDSCC